MLDRLRQPVCGADVRRGVRDILFAWWKQTFLVAAEAGAPAIGDSKAGGGAAALYCAGPCRFQMTPSLQMIVTPSADSRPVLWKQATPLGPMSFP